MFFAPTTFNNNYYNFVNTKVLYLQRFECLKARGKILFNYYDLQDTNLKNELKEEIIKLLKDNQVEQQQITMKILQGCINKTGEQEQLLELESTQTFNLDDKANQSNKESNEKQPSK